MAVTVQKEKAKAKAAEDEWIRCAQVQLRAPWHRQQEEERSPIFVAMSNKEIIMKAQEIITQLQWEEEEEQKDSK